MTQAVWRGGPVYLLAMLIIVNTINWADRQVVPILVPSIKRDLMLSDTELGIISGVAFSLVYAVAAFVFGYLADRRSRRAVVIFGLVCWSLATAASGMATTFWEMFAARFLTGIGESSLYPCAMSLIADAFPPERRGRAIGWFGASTAIGSGVGIQLGGWLVELLGWREVFFIYGAAGILVMPLLLVFTEPARGERELAMNHEPPLTVVVEALKDVRLLAIWTTGAILIAASAAWITWAPSYFIRELGFDTQEVGMIFGIALLGGGVTGSIAGGLLGDMMRRRRFAGQLSVAALAALASAPLVGIALAEVPHWVLLSGAVAGPFAIFAVFPNLQTIVAEIVPAKRLGLTFAVHVFFLGGVGSAVGPFVVGWLSDQTGSLRTALLVPLAGCALSALGAWVAQRVVRARTPDAVS